MITDGWTFLLIKSSAFSSKAPANTTEDVVPSPTSLSTDLQFRPSFLLLDVQHPFPLELLHHHL
jgi:hypothetical protein